MKIKLTERQLKKIILNEGQPPISYPCMSRPLASLTNSKFLKKFQGLETPSTDTKNDTEEKSVIEKEIDEIISDTQIKRIGKGFIFKPPSNYPKQHNLNRGWKLYSGKLGIYFPYKNGYIKNNILSMKFTIPHGFGGIIRNMITEFSLPNYLSVIFISDGTKDCTTFNFDCDDVRIEVDLNKKGSCAKPNLANMIIDGVVIDLGVNKEFITLKPF